MNQHRLMDIMGGQDHSAVAATARMGLAAAEPGYRAVVALRNRMFDLGLRRSVRLPAATISVGNLTTGGTGKTPMVIELAQRLQRAGQHPAVLLRGYFSAQTVAYRIDPHYEGPPLPRASNSDELAVYDCALGESAPVAADADRKRSADYLLYRHPDISMFILDDGFQHRQVRRDLDLVLIDATRPFGFGDQLPRGLLRERACNLRRADAVIITRADQVTPDALTAIDQRITDLHGKPPIAQARHGWTALLDGDAERPVTDLRSMRIAAACGIANPTAFAKTLEHHSSKVVSFHAFDDHHDYQREQIQALVSDDIDAIVTTEKDWVKWKPLLEDNPVGAMILRPKLAIEFVDGSDAVDQLLAERMT